jgi:hypothetical protein
VLNKQNPNGCKNITKKAIARERKVNLSFTHAGIHSHTHYRIHTHSTRGVINSQKVYRELISERPNDEMTHKQFFFIANTYGTVKRLFHTHDLIIQWIV